MFAALLDQMREINLNFAAFCTREAEENSDQESQGHQHPEVRCDTALEVLQQLIDNSPNEPGKTPEPDLLLDIAADLNVDEKTDPASKGMS